MIITAERKKQKAAAQNKYYKTEKGKATELRYRLSGKKIKKGWEYKRRVRDEAIQILGGRCQCFCGCQDSRKGILEIAHKNGDGKQHRKEVGYAPYSMSLWIRRNPTTKRVWVLCPSCHTSWDKFHECKGLTSS